MSKDLVKRWKSTGLLNESHYLSSQELREIRLKKSREQEIAEYLDECATNILNDKNSDEDFNVMALPIVRRVYDGGDGLKAEYEKMKELYFEVIEKHEDLFETFKAIHRIDVEAELCALVGETYIERYGETNEGECDDEAE